MTWKSENRDFSKKALRELKQNWKTVIFQNLKLEGSKVREFLGIFNYLKIRKSWLLEKKTRREHKHKMTNRYFSKKSASRTQTKNDKPLFFSEHKTGHNSGSWPPLEMKSSALDRIFQAGSNGSSFKARNLQNKVVFRHF